MRIAFFRAYTVFNTLFDKDDEIIVVVDNTPDYKYTGSHESLILNYHDHVNYTYKYDIKDTEDDEYIYIRYLYNTKVSDINISEVLKQCIYADFAVEKCILGWAYLINVSKKIIYHLYDDRGLDVISSEKATLKPIYDKFKDWVLEYNQ